MIRTSVGVEPMASGSRRGSPEKPSAPKGARVLVVEDEADVAEMIRYNLGKEGYDVRLASNGTDALRQVKEAKPDAYLSQQKRGALIAQRYLNPFFVIPS